VRGGGQGEMEEAPFRVPRAGLERGLSRSARGLRDCKVPRLRISRRCTPGARRGRRLRDAPASRAPRMSRCRSSFPPVGPPFPGICRPCAGNPYPVSLGIGRAKALPWKAPGRCSGRRGGQTFMFEESGRSPAVFK
jgi:hypothetical protein